MLPANRLNDLVKDNLQSAVRYIHAYDFCERFVFQNLAQKPALATT